MDCVVTVLKFFSTKIICCVFGKVVHRRAKIERISTLEHAKTGDIQLRLNIACFVQSCLQLPISWFSQIAVLSAHAKVVFFALSFI